MPRQQDLRSKQILLPVAQSGSARLACFESRASVDLTFSVSLQTSMFNLRVRSIWRNSSTTEALDRFAGDAKVRVVIVTGGSPGYFNRHLPGSAAKIIWTSEIR
jgi:hypothetical protein